MRSNEYFTALARSPLPILAVILFFWPDSNRLRCPGTTPLKSNQAWVMRRVIGPLPLEQGQALEDVIDRDRSTMAAWCQRSGMGAHGPPVVKTQSSNSAVQKKLLNTQRTRSRMRTRVQNVTHTMSGGPPVSSVVIVKCFTGIIVLKRTLA